MERYNGTCPLTQQQIIDEYFMEARARILDVAAFLDRMDRSAELNAVDDFRMVAMHEALKALSGEGSAAGRAYDIQIIFSDPTSEPLLHLDRKSAFGAFDVRKDETR